MTTGLRAAIRVARPSFEIDVQLDLEPRKTLALMGPNGAGKSTIVHAIAGIQHLTAGQISLNGTVLSGPGVHLPPHRRAIGLLGQQPRLFPHFDAAENIAFAARAAGLSKRAAQQVAHDWLERLGLMAFATQRPAALSGGQQQRVALARALAAGPKLLLVDEPFSALDVQAAVEMRELVREELSRTGTTAVVVSHSGADALALAERLLVIERGVVVQQGHTRQVLAEPATEFVRAVANSVPAGYESEPEKRCSP
ncbi:hypothetical protein CQ019_11015 [Arthrobacter sp. MYb229]|uniref:sulfate/molybdate ABC transporter ATP-binding protein n=1 Tax=Micrococcaceae TaxID=1268 RepID=UPI000CFAAEAC|nr:MULTISPECIES: ATP-binding cassette domain-containing protein [unclassified Arthrobacter]PRA02992.1 hypothetical protein CQ019_11015 [Arthrobacter sp. MYb229]PRB49462.1 hypothetical protein CQ013_12495 [Arthrobacter sp. MYb216]